MLLVAVAALLILGIVYFQVVQGLYSALIMAILTVLCAALAFNYYETLAAAVLYEQYPAYADGVVLLALFLLPLLVMRIITDKILPANVVIGVWADRIGGGILGLISALILVGVLIIATCMLPLGESIMTYQSHNPDLTPNHSFMPFYPVKFTVGTIDMLSRTGLSGGNIGYTDRHDDLSLESFCARNTAGKKGRVDAQAADLTDLQVFVPTAAPMCDLPDNPLLEKSDTPRTVIVRVTVSEDAKGEDGWWRLPATHFRLVTTPKDNPDTIQSYYPVGYLTGWKVERTRSSRALTTEPERLDDEWVCTTAKTVEDVVQLSYLTVERQRFRDVKELTIDWVYQIPDTQNLKELVFRRTARKAITKSMPVDGWPEKQGALARLVSRERGSSRTRSSTPPPEAQEARQRGRRGPQPQDVRRPRPDGRR